MGMAKINIWITDLGNPCEMSKRDWVVAVSHCSGKILEWCGKKYDSVPAKCGHTELVLPPGCYIIRATAHSWWYGGKIYGNWATDRAVIQVACDETYCVTLYAPRVQSCWVLLFEMVFPMLVKQRTFTGDITKATKMIQEEMKKLPLTDFEKAEIDSLIEIFNKQERIKK